MRKSSRSHHQGFEQAISSVVYSRSDTRSENGKYSWKLPALLFLGFHTRIEVRMKRSQQTSKKLKKKSIKIPVL